ncbi:3-phenylpropionate/cinnamic acid dioxygenase small subunit [Hydrogenophaga palleronii]|uniref:3-phenylpropionate/cinnamic acid dioxygenase small subunit n=1 Tax=Hydrogenophaga palleronii TaxID=65655 RepID=A0ABU1WG89_9BURK|nr:AAA family ATPase [Hydrogenophaga palleronii]MDR7148223.1 3-phenylpropionate/cinnamic acid dioxygenase small subunit [Hydrogenophaga palleronii]
MRRLVDRLRDDLNGGGQDFVVLYAYNSTGKTRLSMAFKDRGKRRVSHPLLIDGEALLIDGDELSFEKVESDTLYFNAYTEDLFTWHNDFEKDSERRLHINTDSKFLKSLKELALDERIGHYLARYADFLFDIDYDQWTVSFRKGEARHIKISRGEENIFIWCVFMAICERVIDGAESYQWVKYLYIDDPITSLDDNNAIAVASDLAKLLRKAKSRTRTELVAADTPGEADNVSRMVPAPIKAVVSSHHALFFNVVCNELKKDALKRYFLHRPERGITYTLRTTDDTPFFHHVAMLAEIKKATEDGKLYTYHFNMLRSILEKTATFFGNDDFSTCVHGIEDAELFSRALNLLSHGKYDIYQPAEMVDDNKRLFRQILDAFLGRYQFALPDILEQPAARTREAAST